MKAYLNRGAKIKWENTPFQPELTDERIKQGVDKYFPVASMEPEQGDYLMWDDSQDVWGPHTPRLDDNTDVTTTDPETGQILVYDTSEWNNITPVLNIADDVNITTPAEGDILVYDATAGEWKNKTPEAWELFETKTADGTERFLTSSALPDGVTGIMLNITMTAAAAALALGIGYSFDGTSYTKTSAVANGINTGTRYCKSWYVKDANLWFNRNTAASTSQGVSNLTENMDAVNIGGFLKSVRCYAPANELLPAGSTMEIYIKR